MGKIHRPLGHPAVVAGRRRRETEPLDLPVSRRRGSVGPEVLSTHDLAEKLHDVAIGNRTEPMPDLEL